jgi:predicted nucleotidyltransferase
LLYSRAEIKIVPRPPILDQRKSEIAAICVRHKVAELALFGSAAKGDLRSDSDLDFLVEFVPGTPIGLLEFGKLQAELEAVLHRRVDLVSKRGLKSSLRESVLRQAQPIYAG